MRKAGCSRRSWGEWLGDGIHFPARALSVFGETAEKGITTDYSWSASCDYHVERTCLPRSLLVIG